MSLPTNNKKNDAQNNKTQKNQSTSKFIKSTAKPAGVAKKVRATSANRGS